MVDFALTGKPMVFWAPDADYYREQLRAVYVDPADLPGPSVTSAEEMLQVAFAAAGSTGRPAPYDTFRDRHAPSVDGKAAARALDALLT